MGCLFFGVHVSRIGIRTLLQSATEQVSLGPAIPRGVGPNQGIRVERVDNSPQGTEKVTINCTSSEEVTFGVNQKDHHRIRIQTLK